MLVFAGGRGPAARTRICRVMPDEDPVFFQGVGRHMERCHSWQYHCCSSGESVRASGRDHCRVPPFSLPPRCSRGVSLPKKGTHLLVRNCSDLHPDGRSDFRTAGPSRRSPDPGGHAGSGRRAYRLCHQAVAGTGKSLPGII